MILAKSFEQFDSTSDADISAQMKDMPRYILESAIDGLLPICSSDCERMSVEAPTDGVGDQYWHSFTEHGVLEAVSGGSRRRTIENDRRLFCIQNRAAPCRIDFDMNRYDGCPLWRRRTATVAESIGILSDVVRARTMFPAAPALFEVKSRDVPSDDGFVLLLDDEVAAWVDRLRDAESRGQSH